MAVEPLVNYQVKLTFTDGTERRVDLSDQLWGPVFAPLRDPAFFRLVRVDPESGTIIWPNGLDLDPDVLYAGGTPEWARRFEGDELP